MYKWPQNLILQYLDQPVMRINYKEFEDTLKNSGYGQSLVNFLAELYMQANGGSFYQGAFRILPLRDDEKKSIPGLISWNSQTDFKENSPINSRNTFFFCANAFGDLFGVPLEKNGEISNDKVGVLWIEKYFYEESSKEWNEIFTKLLKNQDSMGTYLARLKEYEWVQEHIGRPQIWECYSWSLPILLGGEAKIDNIKISPMAVHVSFSLQVIKQGLEQMKDQID